MAVILVLEGDTTFKRRAGIVGRIALGVDAFDPRRAFADLGQRGGVTFVGGQSLNPTPYLVDLYRPWEKVYLRL